MEDENKYRDILNHESSTHTDGMIEFLKNAENIRLPHGRGKDAIWSAIEAEIDSRPIKKNVNTGRYLGIAASLLLIALFSILFYLQTPQEITIHTSIAETAHHELPDKSEVTLNANSTISYQGDWGRKLELQGEAFFEVQKGEKFIVSTNAGIVEVLGTSFNVYARENDLEVACKTGKVKVTIPSANFSEEMTPGELITFRSDTVKQMTRIPELMGKWKSGEFYFDNRPLSEVLSELQRQFDVQIKYEGEQKMQFSGYFTNKNLDQALSMVCLPLGLSYNRTSTSSYIIEENE